MARRLRPLVDVGASWRTFAHAGGYTQFHRGQAMWKTVDDLDRYRVVVESTRPDVVVETGTKWGGSAWWFADQFKVDVITVDVKPVSTPNHPRVTYLRGDSVELAATVAHLVAGRRCMVVLDSDHRAPHVEAEIRAYSPLVSVGCYLVVEDTIGDLVGPDGVRFGIDVPRIGGPLRAVEATLVDDPAWERDEEVEQLTQVSHHPAGWWRRVS